MELHQLKGFVKAAETLNFSEAAKSLCVNQSSFSQYIKQLEYELGANLFERNSHEVTLTEAGEELLPYAKKVVVDLENCKNRMNDLKEMKCGTLNIGVTHSFSMATTETVLEFKKKNPNVMVNIYYRTMEDLMVMLLEREVDFVLSYRPIDCPRQIESHMLFEDCLSAVVRADHPLANKKSVTIQEMARYPMVLPAKGLQARSVLDKMVLLKDVDLDVRIEVNLVSPLMRLVREGNLISVLSHSALECERGLVSVPINDPMSVMEGSYNVLKGTYIKASVREFVKLLCDNPKIQSRLLSGL